MMHPPRQIIEISPNFRSQWYSAAAAFIRAKPWAYEQILDAYSASRMASRNSLRSPEKRAVGPFSTFAASTRSFWIAEMQRAKTASAMVGAATPSSRAESVVHLPVPFWPALSRITSTIGWPVSGSFRARMSAVIWIR